MRKDTGPALIVGGGIAGAALGIAFARAGIQAVVYEASAAPRDDSGAFLNLAPNGLSILRQLGLEHLAVDAGFRNDRLVFHNEAGRVLADVRIGGITLMRGALSRALREAAIQSGVRFEFGKALQLVEEEGDGLQARFADGTSVSGRFLVGADGIHSRTRQSFITAQPAPRYTGMLNLGGITRTDLAPTGNAMHMFFGHRGFFGYAARPTGEVYWFSNFAHRVPAQDHLQANRPERYRVQLLAHHRDDPPAVTRILETVHDNIGAFAIYDIASLPRWHRGRVCLIGDAAHAIGPHVGQGAALALEDAFVLAQCVRDIPSPSDAFATFERIRRRRVDKVAKQSRRTAARKAPTGRLGRSLRDLMLPIFLRKSAQSTEWLYRSRFDWNETIMSHVA